MNDHLKILTLKIRYIKMLDISQHEKNFFSSITILSKNYSIKFKSFHRMCSHTV